MVLLGDCPSSLLASSFSGQGSPRTLHLSPTISPSSSGSKAQSLEGNGSYKNTGGVPRELHSRKRPPHMWFQTPQPPRKLVIRQHGRSFPSVSLFLTLPTCEAEVHPLLLPGTSSSGCLLHGPRAPRELLKQLHALCGNKEAFASHFCVYLCYDRRKQEGRKEMNCVIEPRFPLDNLGFILL